MLIGTLASYVKEKLVDCDDLCRTKYRPNAVELKCELLRVKYGDCGDRGERGGTLAWRASYAVREMLPRYQDSVDGGGGNSLAASRHDVQVLCEASP